MFRLFILAAFILTLAACEEYFVPDIDPQENVLVFDGLITNHEGPHYIKISRSAPYNSNSDFEKVSGFLVYVEDIHGNITMFPEKEPGLYLSDSLFKGTVGNKYRMVARANDTKTYYSEYDELLSSAPIDTITGVYHEKEVLKYSEQLGYYEESQPGVNVLCSFKSNNNALKYRYEYEYIFQTRQIYPGVPSSITAYVVRPKSSLSQNCISVVNTQLYSNNEVINNPVDFVSIQMMEQKKYIDSLEPESDGDSEPLPIIIKQEGFLVHLKQYSLGESSFAFWDAIYNQQRVSGQIFDPIESQVIGNIYCDENQEELVFGYFGASTITSKEVHIKLNSNNTVQLNPVNYFPELDSTMWSFDKFDFWVN